MSRAGVHRFERWLSVPAPAERLAVFRVLTGVFVVAYFVVRFDVYFDAAGVGDARFDPVGVLSWLDRPVDPSVARLVLVMMLLLGAAYTAGVAFRLVGPAFGLSLLLVTTYRNSGGQLLYFENLAVLHVLVVGCSPAADALALGRRPRAPIDDAASYGWPLRLAALVTAATYVLAGAAKFRIGGIGWIDGESLRNHVAFSAARLRVLGGSPSPLAGPLARVHWIFTPLALATVAIELGAPVALLGRRCRTMWVLAAWCLHAAIAATMFVVFPYPLFLVAFAPLFPLERLAGRRHGPRQFGEAERSQYPPQRRTRQPPDGGPYSQRCVTNR